MNVLPLAAIDWSSILNLIWATAATTLLVPLVLFIIPRIPSATNAAFSWLTARAKEVHNQYASSVLQRLTLLVQANVLAAEQTRVGDLKAMCEDGKITTDELKAALAKVKVDVLAAVKSAANAQQLWAAAIYVFSGSESDLSKWVNTIIEAQVAVVPTPVPDTPVEPTPAPVPEPTPPLPPPAV